MRTKTLLFFFAVLAFVSCTNCNEVLYNALWLKTNAVSLISF